VGSAATPHTPPLGCKPTVCLGECYAFATEPKNRKFFEVSFADPLPRPLESNA